MIGPVERARTVGAAFAVALTRRDDADATQIHSLDALLDTVTASLPSSQPASKERSFDDGSGSFGGNSGARQRALLQSGQQQIASATLETGDAGLTARIAVTKNDAVSARAAAQQVATAARSVRASAQALAEAAGGLPPANAGAAATAATVTRPVSDGGVLPTQESAADIASRRAAQALTGYSSTQANASAATDDLPPVGVSPGLPSKQSGSGTDSERNFSESGSGRDDLAEQAARRAAAALAATRGDGEQEDIPPVGNPLGRQPTPKAKSNPGESEDIPPVGTAFGNEGSKQDTKQQELIRAITDVVRRASDTLRQGKAILDTLDTLKPADEVARRALEAGLGEADREIGLAAFSLTQVIEGLTGSGQKTEPRQDGDTRKLDLSI